MEAEYVGYYLGVSNLTKGTTGLGVIQKPLRERYFAFRKSSENKLGPEIGIRVNPRGLVLLFPGTHPGHPNDEFYDISSIHFIEAVQFVTIKRKDKRHYGAFVPIDDNLEMYPNQDALFVQLDKKYNHLTKISHPPMVACIMRRPTGVKAVDCHMFVIPVEEDAFRMADMIHRFQERPDNPEFYSKRELPPEPDVVPRNHGPQSSDRRSRDNDSRTSEDYTIYKGGRGVELKQEHFMRGPDADERPSDRDRMPPPENVDLRYGYPRNRPDNPEMRDRVPSNYEGNRNSREIARPGGKYVERDSFGNEHEFDNRLDDRAMHQRQRSGEDKDLGRHGGFSPRNEFPDRRVDDRRPDNFPGKFRDQSPPEMRRGPPPSWQNRGSRDNPRAPSGGYDENPYPRPTRGDRSPPNARNSREFISPRGRSPPRGPMSPRGQPSPRSTSPDDNVYSASNLESRLEDSQVGKPVAKVQPNRKGVRVLPSLPILDVKNQLKPVSPRSTDAPSKVEEKPTSYNYNMGQDNDSVEESPYDNANYYRYNRPRSDKIPQNDRSFEDRYSKTKSDDYSYNFNSGNQQKQQQPPKQQQWSFESEKEKFLKSRDAAGPSVNEPLYDNGPINGRGDNHVKDMEIANMLGNLRTSNSNFNNDVDFERDLGYLP
ncbi:hypothetical protein ACF0H5_017509 [Mactra antiquata]